MPVPSQEQIEPALQAFETPIVEIVLQGWDQSAEDRARNQYKRTHRCIVHDRMMRLARARFHGVPGVHVYEKHETAYFLFGDFVLARIKPGDERGLGRNNHTQASFAFINPEAEPWQLPLGLPDTQRVDIVYLLNQMETRIEQILVAGRDGEKALWNYALYPRAAKPVAVLPIAPSGHRPPASPADVLRVPEGADQEGKKGA